MWGKKKGLLSSATIIGIKGLLAVKLRKTFVVDHRRRGRNFNASNLQITLKPTGNLPQPEHDKVAGFEQT